MRTPLLALASLLAAGCAASNALNPAVAASLTSQGGELGDWKLDLNQCGFEKDKGMVILVGADAKRWVRIIGPSVVDTESAGGPYEVRIPVQADSALEALEQAAGQLAGDLKAKLLAQLSSSGARAPGQLDPKCSVAMGYSFAWGPLRQGGFRFDCTTPGGAHLVGRGTYADCGSTP
jgi:hypothetical protein